MFRSRRMFAPVALTLLLLLLAAGPQPGAAQQKVTLRVWDQFTGPENDAVNKIYKGFTDKHPNITIKREAVQTEQMRQTVKTALSSGTGPDIIFYDAGPGYAGVLAQARLLRPLDDMAAQYGWTNRIAKSAIQGTTINGKFFGLPLQVDLIGMYYNKTQIDKAGLQVPQTFDQLVSFCKQAKDKGYTPLSFGDNPGYQAFWQFSMTSNDLIGADAMQKLLFQNQGSWNTPQIVQAIKLFFVDLNQAGCFPKGALALTDDDAASLFYSGKALMQPTGSWFINNIEQNIKNDQIGFMPFPALPGAKGQYWLTGVGSAYYVAAKSQHQAEAGQFLDYLFSPEAIKSWVEQAKFFLPVQFDTGSVQVSPLFKSVLDVLNSAASGKTELGYNIDVLAPAGFNDTMQNGFQAILSGSKTPEQQAADLQKAWEEGMKK